MLNGSACVFSVADIAASLAYWRDALGFSVAFQYGEPVFYVVLCRDDVGLHLIDASHTKRLPGQGALCVFVDDVDALHDALVASGARVLQAPQDRPYLMRDFDVTDLDGNAITFGMSIAPA